MNDYHLERRLRAAAEEATPEVFDSVLHALGKEQPMETTNLHLTERKTGKRFLRQISSLAAAAALVVGAHAAYVNYHVDAVVGIDVNPSLELKINRSEKVLSATPLNEDAKAVMEGMDLKNVDLDVAVNAIIGSMLKNGYLGDDDDNAINVCVENSSAARGEALSQKLTDEINSLLQDCAVSGKVMTQTQAEDSALEKLATKHNVSVGKAALAQLAVSENSGILEFEDAVRMSVKELWALVYPDSVEFISLEKAKAAALKEANVEEAVFTGDRLYQKGTVYRYSLDFRTETHKYHCEIDALTGKILELTAKELQSASLPTGLITDSKAQAIAYADAGVKAGEVKLESCKMDKEDGAWVYELEFRVGANEYDYEIDAVSGDILKRDMDLEDGGHTDDDDQDDIDDDEDSKEEAPAKLIKEEKALQIACKDAGVKSSHISLIKCHLDEEDGTWVYELEFMAGANEYDYEIDAVSGDILKRDMDLEDGGHTDDDDQDDIDDDDIDDEDD